MSIVPAGVVPSDKTAPNHRLVVDFVEHMRVRCVAMHRKAPEICRLSEVVIPGRPVANRDHQIKTKGHA